MSLIEILLDEIEEKIAFLFANRESEEFEEALDRTKTLVQRVYEEAPQRAETNYNMALIHQIEGDIESATPYYNVAMELDPKNPDMLGDRGVGLVRAKRYKEGIAFLEQAREVNPKDKTINKSLAHCKVSYAQEFLKEDNYNKAIEIAEKACELLPKDPDIRIRFANYLRNKGAVVFAERYYKEALNRLPKRDARHDKIKEMLPHLYFRSPSAIGVTEDGRQRPGSFIWM